MSDAPASAPASASIPASSSTPSADGTFFAEGQGSAAVPTHDQQTGGDHSNDNAGTDDRPEWLFDKYETVEAQAQAYKDLHGRYTQKNEKFREDVAKEFGDEQIHKYFDDLGVPEHSDAYQYPENFEAPDGEVDEALRDWAHENNVSTDAFSSLIENVWGLTQANYEGEAAKLGSNEQEVSDRINPLNSWIGANFDEGFNPVIAQVMRTAEGVEFMEALQDAMSESGFAPDPGDNPSPQNELSRESIRALMQDPRYANGDLAYHKMIQDKWDQFAKQQEG